MTVWDRVRAAIRAFVLGQYVVEPFDRYFGHDVSKYSPEEYGEYIATSNGVYACSTQRAQFLSSLPLRLYKLDAQGEKKEINKGELYALLQKVNPFWTGTRLIEMTELTLCLWGQAFWFLERGESGKQKPKEIWWAKPDRVKVIPHPEKYIEGFLYEPIIGGASIAYGADEVIWFRYPNPNDEYAPLSPLAAARIAADYASAAMKSNKNLFENGIQMGGFVSPKSGQSFSDDQAKAIETAIDRRLKGVDKFHRWGVFRFDAQVNPSGVTPREAEFLGGQKWSLEDICRAYKWPLDLLGGQRTYENLNAALKAAWTNAVIPEGRFMASELIEQLLPMFSGQADLAEFDSSDIDVLQEAETERWIRAKEQIQVGAKTVNEWRDEEGLDPVAWGNTWWMPITLVSALSSGGDEETTEETTNDESLPRVHTEYQSRAIEYGSPEHERLWRIFERRTTKYEKLVSRTTIDLFERQRASVLDKLKAGSRTAEEAAGEPFNKAEWIKRFRTEVRPVLGEIVADVGQAALDDLALSIAFDVARPEVARFLERRAQRFAQRVNETTWTMLKTSLNVGINEGENIAQLQERVLSIMAERIRSTPETIARTEVVGASNGGTLEAWKQSQIVETKVWLAALDARTRDTHIEAHGQTVPIDEDFTVGGGKGPAPGQIGIAEEDINCRCSMTAGLKRSNGNGHGRIEEVARELHQSVLSAFPG